MGLSIHGGGPEVTAYIPIIMLLIGDGSFGISQRDLEIFGIRIIAVDKYYFDTLFVNRVYPGEKKKQFAKSGAPVPCFGISSQTLSSSKVFL